MHDGLCDTTCIPPANMHVATVRHAGVRLRGSLLDWNSSRGPGDTICLGWREFYFDNPWTLGNKDFPHRDFFFRQGSRGWS